MSELYHTAEARVLAAMVLCLAGAVITLAIDRRRRLAGWLSFGVVAGSAALVLAGAIGVLRHGPAEHGATFFALPQLGFAMRLYVDGLSAVFLALIAVVAVCASFHAIDYMVRDVPEGSGRFYPHLLVFIAAMFGLVSTTDMMWFFFIFWQMMTLTGWAMIRYDRRDVAHQRAASRFLWMMQFACAVTMLGAAMLAGKNPTVVAGAELMRFDFDAVAHQMPHQLVEHPVWVGFALLCFLVGFGVKLGMWPFGQLWLPDAHPAAPSPVSAMLSGVMLKTGVYGLMRYFLCLVPADALDHYPAGGWGLAMVLLGTVTLFSGTLKALRQEQSKRLLAYSSIGQVGYILMALGFCLTLLPQTDPTLRALAGVAFVGALFHTLNHGIFKSLLFLSAGSVLHATGTQNMNRLGGLLRFMPWTGFSALVGAMAIAGVPLLSGFASKWPMFVAGIGGRGTSALLPFCTVIAILTSALTLALMIKFYGAIFLTRASDLVSTKANGGTNLEVGWKMRTAQTLLAGLCVTAGLLPLLGIRLVARAVESSPQGLATLLAGSPGTTLLSTAGAAVYAPAIVLTLVGVLFGFTVLLARAGGSRRRVATPWLCGYTLGNDANRLAAGHYYSELHRAIARMAPTAGRLPATPPRRPAPNPETATASAWLPEKN
jgi:formate hydrogenlyase subunit 3/multisubunit Na+/H+ antiporter MnhD subunit